MLDRERADFFRTLDVAEGRVRAARASRPRSRSAPSTRSPGVIDLVDMQRLPVRPAPAATTAARSRSPTSSAERAQEYREKLMDEVAETSDALMERYLEGEEISHEEIVDALKDGTNHGSLFPGRRAASRPATSAPTACSTRSSRTCPRRSSTAGSRSARSTLEPDEDKELFAYVFKTRADPFAGRINLFRVYQGVIDARHAAAQHARPRQGADRPAADASRAGHDDRPRRRVRARRHRRRREAQGDARRRLARGPRRADRDAERSSSRRR